MAISEEEIDKFITKISMGKYAGKFHYDQLRIVAELHLTELSSSTAKIKELEGKDKQHDSYAEFANGVLQTFIERFYKPISTAPKDGTSIIGLYDGEESEIHWQSEQRQCAGAGVGGGNGYFGAGWEDCELKLIADEPKWWRPVESERDALKRQLGECREAVEITAIRSFNIGYSHGHEDTVEGQYTQIMPQDISTYHVDLVKEMLRDGSLPEALASTKPIDEGGGEG